MFDELLGFSNYFSTGYFWGTTLIAVIVAYVGVFVMKGEDDGLH